MKSYPSRRCIFTAFAAVAGTTLFPPLRVARAGQERKPRVVEIKGFAFSPAVLKVKHGDEVKWVNRDIAPHTATSDAQTWDSGYLGEGDSAAVLFEDEGEFSYKCLYHPQMKGKIIVEP